MHQPVRIHNSSGIPIDASTPLPVSAASLPLPSGAALSANQILSYKGADVSAATGAAEELSIPANTKRAILWGTSGGEGHIALNSDATTSDLILNELNSPFVIDMLAVTKLSVYPTAGKIGAWFYG